MKDKWWQEVVVVVLAWALIVTVIVRFIMSLLK